MCKLTVYACTVHALLHHYGFKQGIPARTHARTTWLVFLLMVGGGVRGGAGVATWKGSMGWSVQTIGVGVLNTTCRL